MVDVPGKSKGDLISIVFQKILFIAYCLDMNLSVIVSVNASENKPKELDDAQHHLSHLPSQSTVHPKQMTDADIPLSPSVPNSASSDPPRSFSSLSTRTAMTSSLSTRSTVQSPQISPGNLDVESLRKEYLHVSAERAKERKRQEEEERLRTQERARRVSTFDHLESAPKHCEDRLPQSCVRRGK